MLPALWRRMEIAKVCAELKPSALIGVGGSAGESPIESLCTIAATELAVRFVLGFGRDLPDGVMSLDEALQAHEDPAANPVTARKLQGPALIGFTARAGVPLLPVFHGEDELLAQGAMTVLALSLDRHDVILNPYPLSGATGLALSLMPWLISGGALLQHQPFDYDCFVRQLVDGRATMTALPPSILGARA
jgi:mycobactin salicyl-AMP ligase